MHIRPASALRSLVAATLMSVASSAIAATFASVVVSGGAEQSLYNTNTGLYDQTRDGTNGELRLQQSDPDNVDVNASINDLRTAGLANLSSSGSAAASIAGLRMSALVTGGAGAQNGYDSAFVGGIVSVAGSVYDEFVILVPGLALGSPLELTGSVYTDATTRNIGSASSTGSFDTDVRWQSQFRLQEVGGSSTLKLMDQACRYGTTIEWICSGSGPVTGELTLSVPNGARLALQIIGSARAYGTAGAQGPDGNAFVEAGADLGSTIAWGGITNLRDANGNAITNFTAMSTTSGFDYREGYVSAVPLPSMAGLLAATMAGVAAWRGRRRQARTP